MAETLQMRKVTTVYNAENFKDSDIIEMIISGMSQVKYKPHFAKLPDYMQDFLCVYNLF